MPEIAVLAIGDELLNGSLSDTNSAAIARRLGRDGFVLGEVRVVGDNIEEIRRAVYHLADRYDVLIATGGLGPTGDDLTAAAVAAAAGVEALLSEEALRLVDAYFVRLGRPRHDRNASSAIIPAGATPLKNPRGTAPGFTLNLSGCDIYALPGVPDEMAAMVAEEVAPRLIKRFGRPRHEPERVLTLFGIPEPQVEEKLLEAGLPDGVQLAFGVDFPLVLVKLRAAGADAAVLLDRAVTVVASVFADAIVARGEETIAAATAQLLRQQQKTLALAESCTGGLIGTMLTDIPGASTFLDRGAVTYSNRAKQEWLGVPDVILDTDGAVSEACARAMAEGIRAAADTDYALAVTGIAGPDGGSDDKPVGTVYIALADRQQTRAERHLFAGDRGRVRMRTACAALAMLQRRLKQANPPLR